MNFNHNSGYGLLDSIHMAAAQYKPAGKVFVVCPSTDDAWEKLAQVFRPDPDGVQRLHSTITLALAACDSDRGDLILVAPGAYDETVTVSVANVTIVGLGGRGAAYIEPSTAGAEGMQVTADDVTVINLGIAGEGTASYALNLNAAARFRAIGCKIEGVEGATDALALLNGTADDQTADVIFDDCEFAWGGRAIVFDDSAYGYVTQVVVKNCRFHNIVTNMFGVNTNGLVKNLELIDCVFDNQEDGTAPTDYILLSDNGNTGIITGCRFATATNATGVLTIGTGLLWVVNATEAGWSTARPA